jgi:hypothetical protein
MVFFTLEYWFIFLNYYLDKLKKKIIHFTEFI